VKSVIAVVLGGLVFAAAPRATVAQGAPALTVRVVRFYRPEYQQTVVKTFVEFPYISLTPTGPGPGAQLSYRISVKVTDSTGLTLMEQPWRGHVDASFRNDPRAGGLEMFEFPVKAGRYSLTVTVQDSVGGGTLTRTVPVEGFASRPAASDLVVSSQMRIAGAVDTVPQSGEWRRGSTVVRGAADVVLDPIHEDRGSLYYLLEAYGARPDTGAPGTVERPDSGLLSVKVVDTAGHAMIQTPASKVLIGAGGGILRGQLPLTGLPEGHYQLETDLTVDGVTTSRSAPFRMGSLQAALDQDQRARELALVSDSGYFGAMDEAALDEAYAPLDYVARSDDQMDVWKRGLTVGAKRNFLIQFWARRDPTPGTPKNEARERFYGLIALANQKFTERGANARPGWRSDRGRIFIKNGDPADRLQRQNVGIAQPYEVWRYASGRGRWYIFVDRSGFGAFELVATNDLHEPTRPDWQLSLGSVAVSDIQRYLNIDFEQSTTQQ
jgi:GWxTD domain-containing protein